VAQIVAAEGIISVNPGPGIIPVSVAPGTQIEVCAGETVQTGRRSQASVRFLASNQIVGLNQNTTIRILADMPEGRTLIDLLQGIVRLFNPIGRQLDIRTPFVTAGTEGTEFFVSYDPQSEDTLAGVIEGLVRVTRNGDLIRLAAGEAVRAPRMGPLQRLDIRPKDAVRWTIFYPAAIWALPPADENALDPRVSRAWQAWRTGDLSGFATALDSIPPIPPLPQQPPLDARSLVRFAALLLVVGQVDEATAAIDQAESLYSRASLTPRLIPAAAAAPVPASCGPASSATPLIPALRSIIAVAQNQTEQALTLSDCAVAAARAANDQSATIGAAIARSYALQSAFRLEEARAILATVESANDPLVLARLAELDLSLGNTRAARREAQRASALAPSLSLTSSILGFAALADFDFSAARTAFQRAATQNPGDPLPHLGLGLVTIRSGNLVGLQSQNLDAGRRELVVAVALDPENSIARSYLGRTYAGLHLYDAAFREWALAEGSDPQDPTAALYRAFAERALNRPIEALRDIESSIARNDNRAVYRSRLLLDQDLATRTTDLASVYRDLGFDQLALSQAYRSLSNDPSNPGAHRFVSDTYLTMPRDEIASDSELLQSLVLQPLNVQPLRPRLAREGLGIIDLQGPFRVGYNEFSPLFASNGLSLLGDAFGGNLGTYGENVVASGIYNNVSFSAGQFYYRTEGIEPLNRRRSDIESGLVQVALSDRASLFAEFHHSGYKAGQDGYYFAPFFVSDTYVQSQEDSHYRLGGRFDITPAIKLVGVWTQARDTVADELSDSVSADSRAKGMVGEAAVYISMSRFNMVVGGSYYDGSRKQDYTFYGSPFTFEDVNDTHGFAWAYLNVAPIDSLQLTFGASFDSYRSFDAAFNQHFDRDRLNPKVGVSWDITSRIVFRAAYFDSSGRRFVAGQTIEPTQIAGFNQLFDDLVFSHAKRWGAGFDFKLTDSLFTGVEWSERRLTNVTIGGDGTHGEVKASEENVRAYLNWTINDRFVFSSGVQWDDLVGDVTFAAQFAELNIVRVPAEIRYYDPSGFFALLGAAFVHETGTFFDPFFTPYRDHETFAVVNAGAGWRIPGRSAVASLQITNLFNTGFRFQDVDVRNPAFIPHRMIQGRITFSF